MLGHAAARQPAPMLAMRPTGLRLRRGVDTLGNAIGSSLAEPSSSTSSRPLTFSQDVAAREAAADPLGLGDFTARTSSGAFVKTAYSPDAGRSATDIQLDRLIVGDRLADLVAPAAQSSGPAVANIQLSANGIGYPYGDPRVQPVVVTGQSLAAQAAAAQMDGAQGWANVYDEYGLFTMPGSAPIWNRVVAPVASAVSTAATFPQHFKSAVLSELEAKGQDAARRGDDRALMVLGIKHTFVDMMLPGSPQELAIGVGAGAVISKVLPAVTGVLNRVPVLGDSLPQLGNRISAAWAQGMENLAAPRALNLQFGGLRIGNTSRAALSSEDALVLQGDASRAQIVQAIGEAAQPSVKALLALDPEAQIGFRGSLANGLKNDTKLGPNGERVAFNGVVATRNGQPYTGPQGYDADFFVVSDNLAAQLGNKPFFRNAARLDTSLNGVFGDFGTELQSNPLLSGMKVEPPTFRVFTSTEIQKKLNAGDAQIYFIPGQP